MKIWYKPDNFWDATGDEVIKHGDFELRYSGRIYQIQKDLRTGMLVIFVKLDEEPDPEAAEAMADVEGW